MCEGVHDASIALFIRPLTFTGVSFGQKSSLLLAQQGSGLEENSANQSFCPFKNASQKLVYRL